MRKIYIFVPRNLLEDDKRRVVSSVGLVRQPADGSNPAQLTVK